MTATESTPRVSVIIAIFNAEKTLPRLLDSLKAQTMQEFEALLIDDGSTDGSGSVCDRYAASDPRFKAFHKANEGIGTTRQFGIEHASGEYTIHADADDWVEPDYLERLYDKAVETDADMVICDFLVENGTKTVYRKEQPTALDTKSVLNSLICRLNDGPCNKLLKRSVYVDNGIRYVSGLNFGEDQLFNLQFVMTGATVTYLPVALYHCDVSSNPDSASRGISISNIQHQERFITMVRQLLPKEFERGIDSKHLDIVYMAIKSRVFTKKEFKEKYSFLSRVRWKDYLNKVFSIRLIIWTSLNVSYGLAIAMSGIKKVIRHIKQ